MSLRIHHPMITAACFAFAAAGCDAVPAPDESLAAHGPRALLPPAGLGAGQPNLFLAGDTVLLSWLEPAGDEHALRFSHLVDDTWSASRTVVSGQEMFVNWADFPSVIQLTDGTLAAHWLRYSGPGSYSYDAWISTSTDGGATWGPPARPYDDRSPTEHGFLSLFELYGSLSAVWLDGRAYADSTRDRPFTSLRTSRLEAEGAWADDLELDPQTCDCCQTSVAYTGYGLIAAYRGRTKDEVRDIRVVRHESGSWSAPTKVHEDGWVISACPVNGPSIAAHGDTVAVAWFTAADDRPRILLAYSYDGGRTFGAAIPVDSNRPVGRVGVELAPGGSIVLWLASLDGGAGVMARPVLHDGRRLPSRFLGESSTSRSSGFPVAVLRGSELVVAWTMPGEGGGVRVVAVPGFGAEDLRSAGQGETGKK